MKRKFIISIIFSVLFLFIACENEEISTGLVGTVFRGPISPVAIDGELNDAVFEAKFGVYTAYIYYKRLLSKLKSTPSEKILTTRIRVSNPMKLSLLARSFLVFKLNLL